MKIDTIEKEFEEKDLQNVLITAFEGGSNYWMQIGGKILPMGTPKVSYHEVPFIERGQLKIIDHYGGGETLMLNREAIERGLNLIVNQKYSNGNLHEVAKYFRKQQWENIDAEGSDIFLQLCLFGIIEYS